MANVVENFEDPDLDEELVAGLATPELGIKWCELILFLK
jgi:hypothetical protein